MIFSQIPMAIVLSPLVGALLTVALGLHRPQVARWIGLGSLGISLAAAAAALVSCAGGGALTYAFGGWPAPYGIVYHIDGVAAVMSALIAAVAFLVFIYAGPSVAAEMPRREPSFFAVALLLAAALQGMVVTGDLFNLYVFLEISSIAGYTLIGAGGGRALVASYRYLLLGTVGATFYLLGLAFLLAMTGTLNMADMAVRLPAQAAPMALLVALVFIVTGFGLKMALFPMHGWLPDAYTYAPSAATALIASVMTKVSAFALLRVLYTVLWPSLAPLDLRLTDALGWMACAAIIAGSVMALAQTDLKRLLAYSSISHLGYVALGLALGNRLGLIGAMLHIVAHAITKGCLFLIAGAVDHRTGGRTVTDLRHLSRRMPRTMGALVVCALSMIGVPPTAGFFSKWYLLLGAFDLQRYGFVAVLLLSSLLNAWYFFRLIEVIYFGPHEAEERDGAPELPAAMQVPILAFAAGILLVGISTQTIVTRLLDRPFMPAVRTSEYRGEVADRGLRVAGRWSLVAGNDSLVPSPASAEGSGS